MEVYGTKVKKRVHNHQEGNYKEKEMYWTPKIFEKRKHAP